MGANKQALVNAVRAHAVANYEQGGWDYVVETMDDAEIEKLTEGALTPKTAIRKVGEAVKLLNDVRNDIRGA